MRASGATVLVAAMVLAVYWPGFCSADCKYPDVLKALGAKPNADGAKIVLLSAGTTSKDFLTATAEALGNLRRTEAALIRSVALETSEDGGSVESKFVKTQSAYNAFVVLDSEFMSGVSPKYNGVLDFYKDKDLRRSVMIIDHYLTADRFAAFVQVTTKQGAESAALLIEAAAAVVAHPRLAWSSDFLRYGSLLTAYANRAPGDPERPKEVEVIDSRNEMITKCLAISG
jgi:hypothetical protein